MKNPENLEKILEEVEQGKHGRPESLKKRLGEELYNKVQEAITEKFQDKTIKEIIKEVINGKYGIGEERQLKLGYMYEIVQNQINREYFCNLRRDLTDRQIEILAERMIEGEFGYGIEGKEIFEKDYKRIQNKINEINGSEIRYNENLLSIDSYINIVYNKLTLIFSWIYVKSYTKQISDEELENEVGVHLFAFIKNKVNEMNGDTFRYTITEECIDLLANLTIIFEFGINKEREEKLGELFPFVQNKVNEKLNCKTRLDILTKPIYLQI